MDKFPIRAATLAGLIVLIAGLITTGSAAQGTAGSTEPTVGGATLFDDYCRTCHGARGTGDGPLAKLLRRPPADLTLLARKNGGVYSAEMVSRIIDGRKPLPGHGGGDMPVWGEAFSNTADGASSTPRKIAALVVYLESIQQK
jgi:mono/diheme cytochrome c family protein